MGIFDLPDISEEDWNAYQADSFGRMVRPQQDSLAFMQQTTPVVDDTLARIAQLAAPLPQISTPQMQAPDPFSAMGGQAAQGLFPTPQTQSQVDPSFLASMLQQYPEEPTEGGVGPTMGPPGPPSPSGLGRPSSSSLAGPQPGSEIMGPSNPPTPGFWAGSDPTKPNIFSWIGQQAEQGAQGLRESGFSQTPLLGPVVTGGLQGIGQIGDIIGGSSQALREGNIPGAVSGVAQGLVGEGGLSGIAKSIATEAQAPTQIFPGIDPETPFFGGLNNPRELAGFAGGLVAPATALERGVGGLVGKGASALARTPAARQIGEVASPYVERALSGVQAAREGIRGFGDDLVNSLGRPAELGMGIMSGEAPQGRQAGGTAGRFFRGTSQEYQSENPRYWADDGLYGPGGYYTKSPEVASSYAQEARAPSEPMTPWQQAQKASDQLDRLVAQYGENSTEAKAIREIYGSRINPGGSARAIYDRFNDPDSYSANHEGYLGDLRLPVDTWTNRQGAQQTASEVARAAGTEWGSTFRALQRIDDALNFEITKEAAPQVRRLDIESGLKLLDIDNPVPEDELTAIRTGLAELDATSGWGDDLEKFDTELEVAMDQRKAGSLRYFLHVKDVPETIGEDVYRALYQVWGGDKGGVNKFLEDLGFNGVTHIGGLRTPVLNAAGDPITHQVNVIFEYSLGKVRNALSGLPGGVTAGGAGMRALESPFFSPAKTGGQVAADVTMGAVGGGVAAATADEDATWQERLARGATGAALGGMLGPIARAPKGVAGVARELLKDESGALRLGVLNPAEGYDEATWRAMSRSERRRINYQQRRGEYAARAGEDVVGDYGAEEAIPTPPPHTADAPREAQQSAYEESLSRMTERGLPEDEADETAYAIGREAAQDEAAKISDEAPRLFEDYPELRADDSPDGDGITADQEIENLTNGVTPILRQNPVVRGRQEAFVGAQRGLPGVAEDELRASIPGQSNLPAYDEEGNFIGYGETVGASSPQAVMKAIADRTGSAPVGSQVTKTMRDVGITPEVMFDPDMAVEPMSSTLREAIEPGRQVLANELPEVRDYVDRVVSGLRGMFEMAHGRRSDAALQQAVNLLRPFALDLARSADPGTGMTSDVLVALMHKGVEATTTPTMISYQRLRQLIQQGADEALIAAARADYDRNAAVNNIYLAGLEAYSSAAGRALRANRADVYGSESLIPTVSGAMGVDAGDVGRAKNFGKAEPAQEARAVARAEWSTRQSALRRGEPVVDRGADWNSPYWQRKRDLGQAANPARSGRRINGPLENEGLLWTDLFVRDDPTTPKGTPLTDNEQLRWLFGLAELEVSKGKDMDDLFARMSHPSFNPDDTDAVLKFWADAARIGGARDAPVTILRPAKTGPPRDVPEVKLVRQSESPWADGIKEAGKLASSHNPPWMSAGKISETLPRDKALAVARNALQSRLDAATEALAKAQREGVGGDIKKYSQAVASARKDLPEELGGSLKGLFERIKAEYPPDYESTRLPGQRQAENFNLQDPATLTKKVELLNQLDSVSRGTQLFRGALSVVTSNMLTSARMVEASAMESAATMVNKLYTQAVWRGDLDGARQILSGMMSGATPAWNNMLYAFRNGMGPMEAMDYLNDVAAKGAPAIRSTPLSTELRHGIQSGWLAPMHRISRAMQEFFSTLTYYGELNRLAHVESAKRGAANELAGRLGAESRGRIFAGDATRIGGMQDPLSPGIWFQAPTDEMRAAALKEAMTIGSGGPHSALAKTIAGLKANLEKSTTPGGKAIGVVANVLFPFVYGIDFSVRTGTKLAIGPIMYPAKAVAAGVRGDTQLARAYTANAGLTIAADLFLINQVLGGNLTGKGPSDPRERQALLEATDENGDPIWRPDAMRVPLPNGRHMWMAYGSLPIVGLTGAIFANAYEAYMFDGRVDESLPQKIAKTAANTVGTVAEGTYFRDMMDLVSIFTDPQSADTAGSRFAGGLVGRIVPAVVRQTAQAIDPNRKAPENALQEFAQNIPGLRNMVPNQVSPFTGEDVRMGWSPASLLSPGTIYYGNNGPNPLATETAALNRQGFTVAPSQFSATQQGHGATILGQRQTGEQVRGAQDIMAEESQRRATLLVQSPQYQAMSPQDKAAALDAVFSRATEAADYDWQAGLTMTPRQRLEREQSAVMRYEGPGLSGLSPSQLARRNEEIGQAKSLLTQYNQMYGEDLGEVILRRQNRSAWRDAVMYEAVDPDLLWLRNRRAAAAIGLDPRRLAQAGAPNEAARPPLNLGQIGNTGGIMPQLVAPPDYSFANRVPPSAR